MTEKKRKISAILPLIKSIVLECDSEAENEENLLISIAQSYNDSVESDHYQKDKRVCIRKDDDSVVPWYSMDDFKIYFMMKKSTFELILSMLEPDLITGFGRPPITPEKQILSVLWLFVNQESFRSVAERFDLAKSSLHKNLNRVSQVLSKKTSDVIKWPTTFEDIESKFEKISQFPGVVGAVDGLHVPIKVPSIAPEIYLNKKNFYSIFLQAIALPDLSFSHVFCAYPGAVNDALVFQNSEVNLQMSGNETYFPEHAHLIGDSAYPLSVNLMVPYRNNDLNDKQLNFNKKLSVTRICSVARAFGQLKSRFERLKFLDVKRIDMLPLYVLAACIMHNICIQENDFVDETEEIETEDLDIYSDTEEDIDALNKRDDICGLLPM